MAVTNHTLAVVVNPAGAEQQADLLEKSLSARGVEASWFETTRDDPGTGQTRAAIEAGASLVIACGGDGTVRACIDALAGTDTTLAIIPAGTGNLLSRNLELPDDVDEALAVALDGHTKTIDVGTVNGEAFAVMAGAGFDARVMRDTSRDAKNTLGSMAYVATALSHLRDPQVGCTIRLDGEIVLDGGVSTVLGAKFGRLQGGFDLFPDANPTDGQLDFLALAASSWGAWARTALAVIRRREIPSVLERWRGRQAVIDFERPIPYELDGDERSAAERLEYGVLPAALSVRVARQTKGDSS